MQLNRKSINNLLITFLFISAVFLPFVGTWLQHNITSENRLLAKFPEIHMNLEGMKQFKNEFDAYTKDNFGFRSTLVHLHSKWNYKFFKQASSKLVIIGKNNWLFYAGDDSDLDLDGLSHFTEVEKEDWDATIKQRAQWLAQQGIIYRFVIAPNKQSVYPEYLPNNYRQRSESRLSNLQAKINNNPYIINLLPKLLEQKSRSNIPLFYQFDSHWNLIAAYHAYVEIIHSLTPKYEKDNIQLTNLEFTVTSRTPGDLSKMISLDLNENNWTPLTKPNQCDTHIPIEIPAQIDNRTFSSESSYASRCESKQKKILIFGDSFSDYLAFYLLPNFNQVINIKSRPDNYSFMLWILQEKPDIVIEERIERGLNTPKPEANFSQALAKIEQDNKLTLANRSIKIAA